MILVHKDYDCIIPRSKRQNFKHCGRDLIITFPTLLFIAFDFSISLPGKSRKNLFFFYIHGH